MTYFEDTLPTSVNDLFAVLATAMVNEGWTETVINSRTNKPVNDGEMVRESIFSATGNSSEASSAHVAMAVGKDDNGNDAVWLSVFTAFNIASIDTISRSSSTVTVTTTAPHPFVTGDVVVVNGTSEPLFHEGTPGSSGTMNTITVTGASTFTYSSDSSGTLASVGGKCYSVYNVAGGMANGVNDGVRININDEPADVYGYVDKFRICGIVIQGGTPRPFYLGQTGRDHVQPGARDVAISNDAILGTGSQAISLDRTPTNMYVGQQIWIISPDSADVEVTTITALSGGELTANFSTAFSSGALVGMDPAPLVCGGLSGFTSDTSTLEGVRWQLCLSNDGTRNGVSQIDAKDNLLLYSPGVPTASNVANATSPDSSGSYQGSDIILLDANIGVRRYLPGFVAFPIGTQATLDVMRTGAVPITFDYKLFVEPTVDSQWGVAIGPGALL